MEKVRIDEVDSWAGPADVKRPLGRALGLENAAINYYELEPGESFAFGYHKHADQEEVFYVLEGEATFETGEPQTGAESRTGSESETRPTGASRSRERRPEGGASRATRATEAGDVTVGAGELVRFAPGEWQRGHNEGDERVRALAIGAPAESGETVIRRACPDCGERTNQEIERAPDGDGLVTLCVDCGAETGRFD